MIKTFTNTEFGSLRTIIVNDEPHFIGKEVAEILGYANPKNAVPKHVDDEDKLSTQIEYAGQKRSITVINESGLYSLIFGSKLPKAKQFKHWVTSEVLPTIRKTGGYVSNDDLFINTYLPFADEPTKMLFRTTLTTINQLNAKIEKDKPLVEFADRVGDTSGLIDVGAFAKLLHKKNVKIGRTKLFAWLREQKYLRHNNEPYQKWINSGIFQTREYTYMAKGEPCIGIKTYITGKGQTYLADKIEMEF
ncbi:MAG: phage antirepressor KilAC domain-containing protein [Bacteroidales bacterium]|nr:phage antirepressor KilAC domain-containing protein [Bacteroidales bacterium]